LPQSPLLPPRLPLFVCPHSGRPVCFLARLLLCSLKSGVFSLQSFPFITPRPRCKYSVSPPPIALFIPQIFFAAQSQEYENGGFLFTRKIGTDSKPMSLVSPPSVSDSLSPELPSFRLFCDCLVISCFFIRFYLSPFLLVLPFDFPGGPPIKFNQYQPRPVTSLLLCPPRFFNDFVLFCLVSTSEGTFFPVFLFFTFGRTKYLFFLLYQRPCVLFPFLLDLFPPQS